MKYQRTDRPRFRVGDRVCIAGSIASRHRSQTGQIAAVVRNKHARTLDKYEVSFDSGESATFWDIQLQEQPQAIL